MVEPLGHPYKVHMNFDSFSHGQIQSKLWLCEELENHIPANQTVAILGGWHNVLGFMMLTRRPSHYRRIINVDTDLAAIATANKLCDAWIVNSVDTTNVLNIVGDCNSETIIINSANVIINCSVEHFESTEWFFNLPKGTLVCIQSSDVIDENAPWSVKSPNPDMKTLIERFPMEHIFMGTKRIQYAHFGYNRFMLIGRT